MKMRIRTLIMMAALAAALQSCKITSPRQAADYNDFLMSRQKEIVVKYDLMLESFDTYVASKMDAALLDLEGQIAQSKSEIEMQETPWGCEELRSAVISYIEVYEKFAAESMPRLVSLYKRLENEFTPEARMEWDNTYKEMDSSLKAAGNSLKAAQAEYAKKYSLKVAI